MSKIEKSKKELPTKEKFYSSSTGRKITDKEYEHVLNVWNKYEIKDYQDLYLKCDILLLADAFEKLRNNNFSNYGLCPSLYLSAPSLRFNAMIKITKIKLELFPEADIYIFLEKDTKGGISYISNRYSKANKKYLKSFDPKQESKDIIYLDENNSMWLCNV